MSETSNFEISHDVIEVIKMSHDLIRKSFHFLSAPFREYVAHLNPPAEFSIYNYLKDAVVSFSIARPDIGPVPGRTRMEIYSDDFLIVGRGEEGDSCGLINVQQSDPGGEWINDRLKFKWNSLKSDNSSHCHNIVRLADG